MYNLQTRNTLCLAAVDKYICAHHYVRGDCAVFECNALSDLCLSACGSARSTQPVARLYALHAYQNTKITKWHGQKQLGFEIKLTAFIDIIDSLATVSILGKKNSRMGLPERQLRSVLFADVTLVSADHIERVAGASGSMGSMKALAAWWELMTHMI